MEQALEEAKGMTFEKAWALLQEERRRDREKWEAEEKKREAEREEDRKRLEEHKKALEKAVGYMGKRVGGVSNRLGELTEAMFSGALWELFADVGIQVSSQSVRRELRKGKHYIAEIDVFVENGEVAIPVEIKAKPTESDVDDHLVRIAKIRKYLDERNDHRELIGAMAGGIVTDEVMSYAREKGMFVLTLSGDQVTIAAMPDGFVVPSSS